MLRCSQTCNSATIVLQGIFTWLVIRWQDRWRKLIVTLLPRVHAFFQRSHRGRCNHVSLLVKLVLRCSIRSHDSRSFQRRHVPYLLVIDWEDRLVSFINLTLAAVRRTRVVHASLVNQLRYACSAAHCLLDFVLEVTNARLFSDLTICWGNSILFVQDVAWFLIIRYLHLWLAWRLALSQSLTLIHRTCDLQSWALTFMSILCLKISFRRFLSCHARLIGRRVWWETREKGQNVKTSQNIS